MNLYSVLLVYASYGNASVGWLERPAYTHAAMESPGSPSKQEYPPKELMVDYIHFQKYGKENALMYFLYNPHHQPWMAWIMSYTDGESNYTRAVNHYSLKLPAEL